MKYVIYLTLQSLKDERDLALGNKLYFHLFSTKVMVIMYFLEIFSEFSINSNLNNLESKLPYMVIDFKKT